MHGSSPIGGANPNYRMSWTRSMRFPKDMDKWILKSGHFSCYLMLSTMKTSGGRKKIAMDVCVCVCVCVWKDQNEKRMGLME